ncbi:YueI family protein [Desulfoscipio sp. XC116]|uniref:YueI family protein n=1 Tax=Desulfoscipio sp. XC116 TaxID=3144975 RepID=UPI00325BD726
MASDMQSEAIKSWVNKDILDRTLSAAIHGAPEIKHGEKMHYLGEFRERVFRLLTKEQVAQPGIYPEIVEALNDRRAAKLIVSGYINDRTVEKYRQLARQMGKSYTVVHDPALVGNAGLVVVADDAVDIMHIDVPDRKARLGRLGIPPALADAAGKKVCEKCYKKIVRADQEEALNYRKLTLTDRFWGEDCAACEDGHGNEKA